VLAVVAVALVSGAALQSATGFGFGLVAAPLLFATLDPQEAVGLLSALGLVVNALTLCTERRRPRPLARESAVLIAWAVPGALLGVVVLRSLDAVALQVLLSAGVLGTLAVRRLVAARSARGSRTARPRPPWAAPLAGLISGGLGTSTTTSGPPLLLYLLGRGVEPAVVRDTLTVCFFALGFVGPFALLVTRTSGAMPDPLLVAAGVPVVAAGHLAGRSAFARLAAGGGYERIVTGVLLASVAAGLVGVLT
jgi:uncharacterized membrane protein YfcA